MKEGAPVRFLILLVSGWTCLRVAALSAGWWGDDSASKAAVPFPSPVELADATGPVAPFATPLAPAHRASSQPGTSAAISLPRRRHAAHPPLSLAAMSAAGLPSRQSARAPASPPIRRENPPAARSIPLMQRMPSAPGGTALRARWIASAWLLVRRDGGPALAPGGSLGGSQAGGRLLYRLIDDASRPLALSGRIYAPLRRIAGAEAAIGLDWRPSARVPIHLFVERRQRLGSEGRSAFAVIAYGGGSVDLGRGWRLDGYAQAGVVGARSRDVFVDGSARLWRRLGPLEAGGGFWGAAQPGAARLDIGPQITVPIRARGTALRLSAEYRFRVAGDARPASGPALTLGVDF